MPLRRAIEDIIKDEPDNVEIDLWLESPGGDAHPAFKLALMLRHAAATVRVVVPDYAKSAATLLALAGDEIYMAPGAELGPLDAQVPEEGSLFGYLSALNIARAADEVARDAVGLATSAGSDILSTTGLSRSETLEAMLAFSSNFYEPLVKQLDPRVVYDAKQLLRVTVRYATRLLERHMSAANATAVAENLVQEYPSHGFVIDIGEAERLGLPARPIVDYDLLDAVRVMHRKFEGNIRQPLITLCPADDLLPNTAAANTDSVAAASGTRKRSTKKPVPRKRQERAST